MMQTRQIAQKKLDEVIKIKKLLDKYKIVGLAHLEKMPANALHRLRTALRKDVVIHVSKKKLAKRAFEESGKKNLIELGKGMTGITAILFTDMNPITLAQYLKSKAVKGVAKAGDIAPIDIMVQEGDTKLAPGPIISELNQNLKVPTMIKNGTIHIRTNTITHKKGEVINDKQAQLLSRLGIEPIEVKLDFYSAWEDGEIIPTEVLNLNIDEVLGNFKAGVSNAYKVAVGINFLTSETIIPLVQKAARSAIGVALELPIFIPDLLTTYISRAACNAAVVESTVFGVSEAQAAPAKSDDKSKKDSKKIEKKDSDDDVMGAGIGSLFG
jgi:large subunit ribosomal protein L10